MVRVHKKRGEGGGSWSTSNNKNVSFISSTRIGTMIFFVVVSSSVMASVIIGRHAGDKVKYELLGEEIRATTTTTTTPEGDLTTPEGEGSSILVQEQRRLVGVLQNSLSSSSSTLQQATERYFSSSPNENNDETHRSYSHQPATDTTTSIMMAKSKSILSLSSSQQEEHTTTTTTSTPYTSCASRSQTFLPIKSTPVKEEEALSSSSSSPSSPSRYAYAFLLGSIDIDIPKYRPFLYSIYLFIHLIRQFGSTQDVVVQYAMIHGSRHDDLPPHELDIFKRYPGVVLKKHKPTTNFYNIQLNKFRVLGLTQYKRVMFLDADSMPLTNLDYYFEYSDPDIRNPPILQENAVVMGMHSPSNGGFFIVTPRPGTLELVNELIRTKERHINNGGKFDKTTGWGHTLPRWYTGISGKRRKRKDGKLWTFKAASADQGLLWYLMVFIQRNFTSFLNDHSGRYANYAYPANFDSTTDDEKYDEEPPIQPAIREKCLPNENSLDPNLYSHWAARSMSDVIHFFGKNKPWHHKGCPADNTDKFKSYSCFWRTSLRAIIEQYHPELDANITYQSLKDGTSDTVQHPKVLHEASQERGKVTSILD